MGESLVNRWICSCLVSSNTSVNPLKLKSDPRRWRDDELLLWKRTGALFKNVIEWAELKIDHFYVVSSSLNACNVRVTVAHGEVPKRLNVSFFSRPSKVQWWSPCGTGRPASSASPTVSSERYTFGDYGSYLNSVNCRCENGRVPVSASGILVDGKDYRWEDGWVSLSASWATISNSDSVSRSETGVISRIRSGKRCSLNQRDVIGIGGICFTKQWRAETLKCGSESKNSSTVA
jgi:hypothetical protein